MDRAQLALDATRAEARRNEDAVDVTQHVGPAFFDDLRVEPHDVDGRVVSDAGVVQRLVDRDVGVLELDVLSDQRDAHAMARVQDALDDPFPLLDRQGRRLQAKPADHDVGQPLALEVERDAIDGRRVAVLHDRSRRDVAEQPDLLLQLDRNRQFGVGPHHDRVGRDPDRAQFAHGVLRRLRLQFAGRAQVRHQRQVDEQHVLVADVVAHLADRFEERQRLDVADRSADLDDADVGAALLRDAA